MLIISVRRCFSFAIYLCKLYYLEVRRVPPTLDLPNHHQLDFYDVVIRGRSFLHNQVCCGDRLNPLQTILKGYQ